MTDKVKPGKPMTCPKCGYEWLYKGKSDWMVSCPKCKRVMRALKRG